MLANVLLVLGLAFIVGGLRHGTQTFATSRARTLSLLLVLSVAAWLIPSLTARPAHARPPGTSTACPW